MGVATDYYDWRGSRNEVPESTVAAVLAAMDIDASSEEAAQSAIERHHQQRWSQMLPPVVVLREGWTPWFWVHIPHSDSVEVWVELEDGTTRDDVPQQEWWVEPVEVDGDLIGEATFELPADLPMGWHTLEQSCCVQCAPGSRAPAKKLLASNSVQDADGCRVDGWLE